MLLALVLPVSVTVIVPGLIVYSGPESAIGWGLSFPISVLPVLVGCAFIVAGLALVSWTVSLFATAGRGTLAPWAPTQRLVRGPYRYVRNPMISGVAAILLGEAVLIGSPWLLAWFGFFLALNATYIPLVEEPGLVRRFGEEYLVYRRNVPRWLPRLNPWS